MKTNKLPRKIASAGAPGVPFYEFVQPTLYIGEAMSAMLWAGVNVITHAIAAVRRWRWERVTRQSLEGLDDRMLADIGVTRSEIPAVARIAAEYPSFTASQRARWAA